MRHLPADTSLFSSTLRNEMARRRLTNASKIAIDRPNYHDRRDAVQTDHAESENAAGGGRYHH